MKTIDMNRLMPKLAKRRRAMIDGHGRARKAEYSTSIFKKCHYEAIATVMRNAENFDKTQWSETCKDLAEMFERDNPRFDIIRFMQACQSKEG